MRDVMELLRAKEQELQKVKRQVEALRIAAPLLGTDIGADEENTFGSGNSHSGVKNASRLG